MPPFVSRLPADRRAAAGTAGGSTLAAVVAGGIRHSTSGTHWRGHCCPVAGRQRTISMPPPADGEPPAVERPPARGLGYRRLSEPWVGQPGVPAPHRPHPCRSALDRSRPEPQRSARYVQLIAWIGRIASHQHPAALLLGRDEFHPDRVLAQLADQLFSEADTTSAGHTREAVVQVSRMHDGIVPQVQRVVIAGASRTRSVSIGSTSSNYLGKAISLV